MPNIIDRVDEAQRDDAPFVGTIVHESTARKRYEKAIEEWVAGRGSYEDVIAQNPYRPNRSFIGFLIYLLSGQTRSKHR